MTGSLLGLCLTGLLYGFVTAIPSGPVAFLIVRNTLDTGAKSGFASLLGLLCAYGCYLALFWGGLSGVLLNNAWVRDPMFVVGGVLLIGIGAQSMRGRSGTDAEVGPRALVDAFAISLTNPAILVLLGALVTWASSLHGAAAVQRHVVPLLLGHVAGTGIWFALVIAGLSSLSDAAVDKVRGRIGQVAGVVLIGFGLWLLLSTAASWVQP